ncbi:hypothetical protein NDU88_000098, partial [Pleurodeles waltl]
REQSLTGAQCPAPSGRQRHGAQQPISSAQTGSMTMSRKEQPAVTSATWIGDIWSGTTHWMDIRH